MEPKRRGLATDTVRRAAVMAHPVAATDPAAATIRMAVQVAGTGCRTAVQADPVGVHRADPVGVHP